MPTYMYFCEKCDKNFDDLCTFEESKEDKSCPICELKPCPRTYDIGSESKSGVLVKGLSTPNFYDKTSLKAQEKEFMHGAVKGTEEALKYDQGKSPYSKVTMNYTKMEELGLMKRVTEEEKNLKMKGSQIIMEEAAKNMTKEELDRAGTRGDNRGTT